jgi:hypothetical protein
LRGSEQTSNAMQSILSDESLKAFGIAVDFLQSKSANAIPMLC